MWDICIALYSACIGCVWHESGGGGPGGVGWGGELTGNEKKIFILNVKNFPPNGSIFLGCFRLCQIYTAFEKVSCLVGPPPATRRVSGAFDPGWLICEKICPPVLQIHSFWWLQRLQQVWNTL